MKMLRLLFMVITGILLTYSNIYPQDLGVTCGYNASARSSTGGTVNHSLFKSHGNEADWWDDMVEEISYSGLDYIGPDARGYSPNHPNTDAGDPRKYANLCAAMDRRPLDNTFKVAIFDDNAASWTANRNLDKGLGYGYNPPFDCGDTSNYRYIWDLDLKICVQNTPDDKRYKIKNRMVMIFWSVNPPFCTNQGNGHVKAIALMIRKRCMADFGFNPYIVADQSWPGQDPTCRDTNVIDAVQSWFGAPVTSMTLTNFFGTKFGAFCPGFWYSGVSMFMNPNHGQLLINNLTKTVGAGAVSTLGEGFSDEEEGCALWRSDDAVYYDYPNQRPNIMRRFTTKAWADVHKVEAEACDYFSGLTAGTGGTYRNGSINIIKCTDINLGWEVTKTQANAWLEWKELPLPAKTNFMLRYSSAAAASIRFSVDSGALSTINLPATAGSWATIDAGAYSAAKDTFHTVRLTVVSGSPDLNYFNIVRAGTSVINPSLKTVPVKQSGNEMGFLTFDGTSGSALRINLTVRQSARCHLELFTLSGKKIFFRDFSGIAGTQMVPLPRLASGACLYRIMIRKEGYIQ
jgi:hypothetical protein